MPPKVTCIKTGRQVSPKGAVQCVTCEGYVQYKEVGFKSQPAAEYVCEECTVIITNACQEEEIPPEDIKCSKCGVEADDSDDVIVCGGCFDQFHFRCSSPPMTEMELERLGSLDFICSACRDHFRGELVNVRGKGKGKRKNIVGRLRNSTNTSKKGKNAQKASKSEPEGPSAPTRKGKGKMSAAEEKQANRNSKLEPARAGDKRKQREDDVTDEENDDEFERQKAAKTAKTAKAAKAAKAKPTSPKPKSPKPAASASSHNKSPQKKATPKKSSEGKQMRSTDKATAGAARESVQQFKDDNSIPEEAWANRAPELRSLVKNGLLHLGWWFNGFEQERLLVHGSFVYRCKVKPSNADEAENERADWGINASKQSQLQRIIAVALTSDMQGLVASKDLMVMVEKDIPHQDVFTKAKYTELRRRPDGAPKKVTLKPHHSVFSFTVSPYSAEE